MAEEPLIHFVPTDGWGIIVSHLDAKDLASLRATSRGFRDLVDHFAPEVRTFADRLDATKWMIAHRPQSAALDGLVLYTVAAEYMAPRRLVDLLEAVINCCVDSGTRTGPKIKTKTLIMPLIYIMPFARAQLGHPHSGQAASLDAAKISLYRLLLAVARIHYRGACNGIPGPATALEKDLRDIHSLISHPTATPFEGDWDTDYQRLLRELRGWEWWDGVLQVYTKLVSM